MNRLTEEWVKKAEGDFTTACRELNAEPDPNLDAVCFHAQQCAEKYLKALLEQWGIGFPKTHDLGKLVELLLPRFSDLGEMRDRLESLTDMGVEVRYPGAFAEEADAQEAVETAREARTRIREILGIK